MCIGTMPVGLKSDWKTIRSLIFLTLSIVRKLYESHGGKKGDSLPPAPRADAFPRSSLTTDPKLCEKILCEHSLP
eukprot:6501666-Pyramimonas_sp.AAC.1